MARGTRIRICRLFPARPSWNNNRTVITDHLFLPHFRIFVQSRATRAIPPLLFPRAIIRNDENGQGCPRETLQSLAECFVFTDYFPGGRKIFSRLHSRTSCFRNGLVGFVGIAAQHRHDQAVPGLPRCVFPLLKISVGGSSKRKHFPCNLRCVVLTRLSRCVSQIYRSENSFMIPSFRTVPSA